MLSRDCDGCSQLAVCGKRYAKVAKGGKVYCPDGTVHLVDQNLVTQNIGLIDQETDLPQYA
jgi:hypothetical protein